MADLLAEFEELARAHPSQCKVARSREELVDADRAKLDAALAADHIGHKTISRWLTQRGLRTDDSSVRRHRVGECCCRD